MTPDHAETALLALGTALILTAGIFTAYLIYGWRALDNDDHHDTLED